MHSIPIMKTVDQQYSVIHGAQNGNALTTRPVSPANSAVPKTLAGGFKTFRAMLVLLLLPFAVQAQFNYTTNADGLSLTITGFTGTDMDVTVPSMINGLPVSSIGVAAFANSSLTSLTISEGIATIERMALKVCYHMTTVTIPDTVTNIGEEVFMGCSRLANVTIPNSVTSLGPSAFYWCSGLTNLILSTNLTSLPDEAFAACHSLRSVRIPDSVTSIGYMEFLSCENLTDVTFSTSLTDIGSEAFQYCNGLKKIVIPASVINVGDQAFYQCGALTNLTMLGGVSIGTAAFQGCTLLANVMLPNSLTSIGGGAFAFCPGLVNVTIPCNVTNIGGNAFYYSSSYLKGFYFKGNAPSLGPAVFYVNQYTHPTAYYLPGTTGWGTNFGGLSTAVWPQVQTSDASTFGVGMNGFGFNFLAGTNAVIVTESCTNLAQPVWVPLGTNTLTNGSAYFSDSGWSNQPARFYRLRSP